MYDLIIIGGGAAALSAALYAKRFNLNFAIVSKEFGGTANEAWVVDNYLGIKHIMGADLANKFVEHIKSLKIEMIESEVKSIKKENNFIVEADKEYECKSVILATGTKRRKLDVKGEKEFTNKGVAYCATCDAVMFRDKDVVVVGSGDAALNSALLLSEYAKKVYVTVRKDKVSGAPIFVDKAKQTGKIEFLMKTKVKEIKGDVFVNEVVIDQDGKEESLDVQGIFIEIGAEPNNHLAKQLDVKLDDRGDIIVNDCMETNVKGVFAAGDITSSGCKLRQIITSAAEGARAANGAYVFLNS